MALTIAIANRKGGSGKTTSTINIADGLARQGRRTLVVDADSQAQATISCGILPYKLPATIYELLHLVMAEKPDHPAGIPPAAMQKQKLFDLIPSRPDLAAFEIEAVTVPGRESLLRDLLQEVDHLYDFILIDLPPSLGLITVNGLVAADWLVTPMEPSFLSMDGLAQMTSILYRVNAEFNPRLQLMGVLPVKCDLRTNLARNVLEEIRGNFGEHRLLPPIRNDIKLVEAPGFGKTIFEYAPACRGAHDYEQVVQAVLARAGHKSSPPGSR